MPFGFYFITVTGHFTGDKLKYFGRDVVIIASTLFPAGMLLIRRMLKKVIADSENPNIEASRVKERILRRACGGLLKEIVPNIRKTAELVQEISDASTQQDVGVEQINEGMEQVNTTSSRRRPRPRSSPRPPTHWQQTRKSSVH